MSPTTPRLPSIVRQLHGEEHRLSQILMQLGTDKNAHADVWRALVERAVVCLRWAQDALRTATEATDEPTEPQPALPASAGDTKLESGVECRSSVIPVFVALQMLTELGKSGSLRVESGGESFEVVMENGAVIYAHGMQPSSGERLGEILVRRGVTSEEQLGQAIERAKARGERIGTLLLREGLVTPQDLSAALGEQACAIFTRLHDFGDAHWHFEDSAAVVGS